MSDNGINITVTVKHTALVEALDYVEMACNYWAHSWKQCDDDLDPSGATGYELLYEGGHIDFCDDVTGKALTLDYEKIQHGLKMLVGWPWAMALFIGGTDCNGRTLSEALGDGSTEAVDVFVQLCVFGKAVYG